MSEYVPAELPVGKDLSKEPVGKLRLYKQWFHAVMPQRIQILEDEVRRSASTSEWRADCTPQSLDTLGPWFAEQVETRPRRDEERVWLEKAGTRILVSGPTCLTDRTESIAFDVGMYFGATLKKAIPHATWTQNLRAKRYVDYGAPELTGFKSKMTVNPLRLVQVVAYKNMGTVKHPDRLREVFDNWLGMSDPPKDEHG